MIARLIHWSIAHRMAVLLAAAALALGGIWSVLTTPVDALPDLSDVQVILRTSYPGQAPQRVEDQVTYPLATTMMSVPGAKVVRAFSFFGDSFVYVIFDDGTDLYWARSRVLEALSQIQGRLPLTAKTSLGPDATGLGWIFQYALVCRPPAASRPPPEGAGTGLGAARRPVPPSAAVPTACDQDLSQLRSMQDNFLKLELKSLPDVAEVATIGGMVRQYQVLPDPAKLVAFNVSYAQLRDALMAANQDSGGAVLELAETEVMVRASGRLRSLSDFRAIAVAVRGGVPVMLSDVASVQIGPEMRRGIAELDGAGEVTGGVVILRSGKNAPATITAVKAKLAELQRGLPLGVEIVTTYDRSALIERALSNLSHKLVEEFVVVALVCALFLWHLRSALVAIIALPLGVLAAFALMRWQGVNANIMSLGGIAIAIGAMVDAAVVMIENAHKKIEAWQHEHPGQLLEGPARWRVTADAAVEVGPALFFCLLIITLSFIPVFTLQAQEGRLFGPLAFTKTYAMAAAAGLSVTLVPVLMGAWIRGRIPAERANPITRALIAVYRPVLDAVLRWPKLTLLIALGVLASTAWPLLRLGGEFLPPLDEGDLLYMPTALPGLSTQKAAELLQLTDRMIASVPEVARVFGKAGRAETATDPAPLEMFETTVQLKPREQWRPGMTAEKLLIELDDAVKVPGLSNLWIPPIRNRIDMLATGVKSPIGIKVSGADLAAIDRSTERIAVLAKNVAGVSSALAERLTGGRYLDIDIDRAAVGRAGMSINELQAIVTGAIGGEAIGEVLAPGAGVEGRARYSINLRYPREWRDTPLRLAELPLLTPSGQQTTLGSLARISITDGPTMLKSENARPSGWVFIDIRGRDMASVVKDLRTTLARELKLEPGLALAYSGQFESLERANARLSLAVPITLAIIGLLLYATFGRWGEALLILATLPFALTGGVWFLYALGYQLSVATGVGFIALAGVAAEFGVVMLLYLNHALADRRAALADGQRLTPAMVDDAIRHGAVQRVRPKAMTVAVILAGLLPIVWGGLSGDGSGAEIMSRIAAPMLGGMLSAPLLSLLVVPAVVALWWRGRG